MILLCELSFSGRVHVPFNAGLLAAIHAAFPKEQLGFYGAKTHLEELKHEICPALADSISWQAIAPPDSNASYWKRFPREIQILRKLVGTLGTDPHSRLILTSAYPSTILALKIAQAFRPKHHCVQIILHGMSGVVGRRSKRPHLRLQDTKTAFRLFGNKGIHYIVLEQFIRDTLVNSCPLLSGKVDALEHPISPAQVELPAAELVEPIRFGFLGLADKAKGFPTFVELADRTTARYRTRVEFHAIGHMPKNSLVLNGTSALVSKPQGTLMSRTAFLNGVAPLHFIVLPHEAGPYTLTASGVLLDAIAWGKPVVCRRIPIFESMFSKHGDIGYLFNDDEDLIGVVEKIVEKADDSRYRRQIGNLRNARKTRHPEALAEIYRSICLRANNQ
jgi:glycosyltransferase involved in cell wall biosynthesis